MGYIKAEIGYIDSHKVINTYWGPESFDNEFSIYVRNIVCDCYLHPVAVFRVKVKKPVAKNKKWFGK